MDSVALEPQNERAFRNHFVYPSLATVSVSKQSGDDLCLRGSVVRVLPEEVRVQRAVGEGIGRGLRDNYTDREFEPIPDYIQELIARLEQVQ